MKPLRYSVGLAALALVTTAASPVEAAWNNVFQVTCWNCRPRSSSSSYYLAPTPVYSAYLAPAPVYSYSSPAAGCCDPCQQCTTKYVQRCYYQPVTTYQTQTYYQAVTSYQTKTYYEPVTTYRYSCYYDPCSCGYQQVATPVTSYVARQQCCPVQSWVQRCCQVPVTAYQKSYYYEPQTSCCSAAPTCCTPTAAVVPNPAPGVVAPPAGNPQPTLPPPVVDGKSSGNSGGGPYEQYYQQQQLKDQQQSQYRQLVPNGQSQVPIKAGPATLPPGAKLERIAAGNGKSVHGQVITAANAPKAGVQLIFVAATRQSPEKSVTANASGRFDVELAPGGWLVYLRGTDGQQAYHSRLEIDGQQHTPIVLVSR